MVHADIGDTVNFTCISNKTVSWFFNERFSSNAARFRNSVGLKNVLIISNVTIKHAGKYTCHGHDGHTLFEDSGLLKVTGKLFKTLTTLTYLYLLG